jgi:hypothetical protein
MKRNFREAIGAAYFNIVLSTFLLSAKLVFAHCTCASFAFAITRSIPATVLGFTRPRASPVAGA